MKTILFVVLVGTMGLSPMPDADDHGVQIQHSSAAKPSSSSSSKRAKNMELSLTNKEDAVISRQQEIEGYRTRGRIHLLNNGYPGSKSVN
ncbi:hypothetical protein [Fulvivirga imtechensis]|nr:hypothetical protein [Fulvivirga imtechensis]